MTACKVCDAIGRCICSEAQAGITMMLLALKSGQTNGRSLGFAALPWTTLHRSRIGGCQTCFQGEQKIEERHCESLSRTRHPCPPVLNLCTLYRHLTAEGVW
jgi:hypothetical protein